MMKTHEGGVLRSGLPVKRFEDERLLRGEGRFTDNMTVEGECHLSFARSIHGHSRVKGVDASGAESMEGVLAVYTGADFLRDEVRPIPVTMPFTRPDGTPAASPPYFPLATDAVRYMGQAVAAVIAETPALALEAAERIEIEYEELPAVTDLKEAVKPGATRLWEEMPDNIAAGDTMGDMEAIESAFAGAAHVTRLELVNSRLIGNPLEPRSSICEYDPHTHVRTLYTGHQSVGRLKTGLAHVLNCDPEQFRIIVRDVGGGFGAKTILYPEDIVLVYAAGKLKRPVRWCATRSEEFQATLHARDQRSVAELACDGDGRILALKVESLANVGGYLLNPGMFIPLRLSPSVISSMYHIPAAYIRTRCVLTNTAPLGAFRGAGRPEGIYLIERLVDRVARELGMDPVEFRKKNMIAPELMPYTTPAGETIDSGHFENVLDRALMDADWNGFQQRRNKSGLDGKLRGRGIGCYIEWTGSELYEIVTLEVNTSGKVILYSGTQAMGQGLVTSYLQLLSEKLELPVERLEVIQGDTDKVEGLGSVGSRSLFVGGTALLVGASDLLEEGCRLAATGLEAAPEDMVYREGRFEVRGTSIGIDLFELAGKQASGILSVKTKGELLGRSWPNGCHIAEVEVDPETGMVRLDKYTSVDDVGKPVNPMIVEGQIHGGIASGFGQAVREHAVYDGSAQLLSGSYLDYALPRADELPELTGNLYQQAPCLTNPIGAKGSGEIGAVAAPPAIVHAVLDALWEFGVESVDMPLTQEKIWKKLNRSSF